MRWKNFLFIIALASGGASADPKCEASLSEFAGEASDVRIDLKISNSGADPLVLLGEINGLSFATWYHKKTEVFDLAISPIGMRGTYARGLRAGPDGISVIWDESPDYTAQLFCVP